MAFVAPSIRKAHPTGRFDDEWLVVPLDRRVRALRWGIAVVDSEAPMLVWNPGGQVPRYAFAAEDLAVEARAIATPLAEVEGPAGTLFTIDWDAVDAWFEEDTPVRGHAHDPFHRIDVRESSRHVEVRIGGAIVCDSRRALILFETGLPRRFYVPRLDVRMDLLAPSDTLTTCAYKGEASHWHARVDGILYRDIAWTYAHPSHEFPGIADRVCFYDERVEAVFVDGQLMERPVTQWS